MCSLTETIEATFDSSGRRPGGRNTMFAPKAAAPSASPVPTPLSHKLTKKTLETKPDPKYRGSREVGSSERAADFQYVHEAEAVLGLQRFVEEFRTFALHLLHLTEKIHGERAHPETKRKEIIVRRMP